MKSKEFIYIFVFIFLFAIFLFFLPKIFVDDSYEYYTKNDEVLLETKNSKEIEQVRFETISKTIIETLNNITIRDSNYRTINHLLVTNQISNRENSLGQEIIYQYKKNKTLQAQEVTREILNYILEQYDTQEQRKWRNHELLLIKNNTKISTLYKSSHLLLKFNESEIKAQSNFTLSLYSHQVYEIFLNNGTKEEIKIPISSQKNQHVYLSQYFDNQTNQPKPIVKNFTTNFVESNEKYIIDFKMWK